MQSFFKKYKFLILLFFIILVGLTLRLFVIRDNYFYFTMDQGRDAVFVRDILHGHQILHGPDASIAGIYTGPLWYYLLALGFLLSSGHPVAGPLLLIATQVITLIFLSLFLKKQFGDNNALLIIAAIYFSPALFETNLYAFNPFLLPILTLVSTLALVSITRKKQYLFLLASFATGLVIHSQIASLPPLTLALLLYGICLVYKKKLDWEFLVFGIVFLAIPLIPHLLSELQNNFAQVKAGLNSFQNTETGVQVASNQKLAQLILVGQRHLELLGKTLLPQSALAGLGFLLSSLVIFLKTKTKLNSFSKRLVTLTTLLFIPSWLWFSISTGLHDWHLLGLPILFLLSFILILLQLSKKLKIMFFSFFLLSQIIGTGQRIFALEHEHADQSILHNELAAVDWIYQNSEKQNFTVYSYLPSVKDYPYQYLFWWRGKQKYNFVPCHYAVDKLSTNSYVPHAEEYQTEDKSCSSSDSGLIFLIIEPALTQSLQDDWHRSVTKNTKLLEEKEVGKIKIEKRKELN